MSAWVPSGWPSAWRESRVCGSARSHLQRINSRLFRQVDQLIVQVDRRAAQAGDAVGGTRDLVDALKQILKASATDLLAGRIASLPEIDNIGRRLVSAMERTDELVEISVSTAELIEQLLATIALERQRRSARLLRPDGGDPIDTGIAGQRV